MAAEARPKDGLRCYHCTGPLSKDMGNWKAQETSGWNLPTLIRDSFSMIGSALGGTASAFYGFNRVSDAICSQMGQRAIVAALPHWCTSCDSILVGLCRIDRGSTASNSSDRLFIVSCCRINSLPSSTEDDKMHSSRASSTLGIALLTTALHKRWPV